MIFRSLVCPKKVDNVM